MPHCMDCGTLATRHSPFWNGKIRPIWYGENELWDIGMTTTANYSLICLCIGAFLCSHFCWYRLCPYISYLKFGCAGRPHPSSSPWIRIPHQLPISHFQVQKVVLSFRLQKLGANVLERKYTQAKLRWYLFSRDHMQHEQSAEKCRHANPTR